MVEMKVRALSVRTSKREWMCRAWYSVRLRVRGAFGIETRPEGYGRRLNPILELNRVNGELVIMSRNQTMKMLLQAPGRPSRSANVWVTPSPIPPHAPQRLA
jgi:hypothetical protein